MELADLYTRLNGPQEVCEELFTAINTAYGPVSVDLAADHTNAVCEVYITEAEDTFKVNWLEMIGAGVGWLNPPIGDLQPWTAKMAMEAQRGARFVAVLPGAIDADWWWELAPLSGAVSVLVPRLLYNGLPIPTVLMAFNLIPPHPLARFRWAGLNSKTLVLVV